MVVTPDDFQRLLAAVELAYNPQGGEAFLAATKFCLEFKDSSHHALSICLEMTQKKYSDNIRHFGLHSLEHIVRSRWASFDLEERERVKKGLLEYLCLETRERPETNFIKEKTVAIIVAVAKREWPERWAGLLDQLVSIGNLGDVQTDLSLLTLRTLAEDIRIFNDDTSATRVRDLKSELLSEKAMSKILPFLFTKIEQNWLKYETTLLTAAPPDHYAHLVKVAIETLAAYIEWVPASFVDVGCLVKLTPLLSDVNFRLSVCELLTLVATRSANKHNAPANANEYLFGCVQHICKAMSVQFGTEKDYPFHQKLGEFLCTYGSNHLNSLTNGRLPKNYSTFQSLMIAFINYPGFVVAEIVMPYWLLFSKKLASGNIGAHQDVLPQLLTSFSCKMVRVYDLDTSSIPAETVHFLRTDFQDIKEMKTFFGNLRAKMGFCLKTLAPIRATQIFSHLIETLKNYINKPLSVKNLRATFESVVYFLRALMIGTLRDVILNDSDMLEKVSQFYQLFVNVPYTDPQALAHLFDGIESLVVYLEINPTVIEPLVQKH
eukprot:TRINITY_DN1315_c0_g1_i1.p2 TRINITY_DN1315_c0_g1~~TRINITY_DN1315_c0_g1_i1.p2  ORF type:complete len:548 (-),score=72.33 TRINITY_DN1315_c0_g1_i1:1753-3396(-)